MGLPLDPITKWTVGWTDLEVFSAHPLPRVP